MKVLKDKVTTMASSMDRVMEKMQIIEKENRDLKAQVATYHVQIGELRDRIDTVEQSERRNHLILTDPSIANTSEGFGDKVRFLLKERLKVNHSILGRVKIRKIGTAEKPKALVVADNSEDKVEIFRLAKVNRSSNLYINEK